MRNLSVIKGMYRGNGVNTRWVIPFEYADKSQIAAVLTLIKADGTYEYSTIPSADFTVDESAKVVIYPKTGAPISNSYYITIYRNTDLLQLVDLMNQGAAWPDTIEASFDKLHQIVQEHNETLSRTVRVDIGDPVTPEQRYLDMQTYVKETAASASAAAASQRAAATSASQAAGSQQAAAASASAAAASQQAAAASQSAAASSANSASASQQAAAASANQAAASARQTTADANATARDLTSVQNLYSQTNDARNQAQTAASRAAASQQAAEDAAATATSQAGAVGTLANQAENILAGYAAYQVPPWSASAEYTYPAVVSYTDGNTYRCIGQPAPVGVPPASSQSWVRITTRGGDDFFDIDVWGGLMPAENPTAAFEWTLDDNGDIMPKDASDNTSREAKTIAEEALEEAQALRTEAQAAISRAETALNNIPMELDSDGNVTPVEEEENNGN